MIQYWYMKPSSYMCEAIHVQQEKYNKRGRWGKVSRVSNAKQRLNDGLQWVTKRYSRWTNVG